MKPTHSSALGHIPGNDGLPIFGQTFAFLKNPFDWAVKSHAQYGPVFRTNMFFEASVIVCGADFAERFLVDREQVFSNERGWQAILGAFFNGGLLLRDFDMHRYHRNIMQAAFRHEALIGYLDSMQPILQRGLEHVKSHAYPWVKEITLEVATALFLGLEREEDIRRLNQLFIEVMRAATAPFRWNIAGTTFGRGHRARRALGDWIRALIPERRRGAGLDILSVLATAETEDGRHLTDDEIIDHLVFLLMAAHDTTTSALTNLITELGRRPELQAKLRAQSMEIGNGPITEHTLTKLTLIYDCFREVLRLYPPVRQIPRRTLREIEIGGYSVPANTQIWLNVEAVQRDPTYFTNPDQFDPERFSDARAEQKRHRFAWIPFGAGAHTCLGLQFSEIQVKLLMHLFLLRYRWTAETGPLQYVPFIKPKNDTPLVLATN
jgi:cytochrome P450